MDAYPEDYITHNLPLILIFGLESDFRYDEDLASLEYPSLREKGPEIESDFPLLSGQLANDLRTAFLDLDASDASWNSRGYVGQSGGIGLRIKIIGRNYKLPPQKADLPQTSPLGSIVHSPISPLTPGSPTFPDGVLTSLWVTKHQRLIPAAAMNVFPITSDPNMSSLRDNQLKIEINGLKNSWTSSGYKTRFVVILVAEDGLDIQDIDDRLASIRRATNLDSRSVFVLHHDLSAVEVKDFVRSLLSSLQLSIIDYYRDLSKHARRKRNRGTIPPPTAPPTSGTSQTLSLQGWNVHYEFKLGIFAEFRQEMEAAHRNYESAYGTLFGQEVFESVAGWNPSFNDTRLLADVLAIRIIRCLLWAGQTTAAVRSWLSHRARIEDIVSRKGKGTKNYGWEAWDARWSKVMAQLVSQAELPAFSVETLSDSKMLHESIFHLPEKNLPVGERVFPWEMLHHEGYWYYRSAMHSARRRALAEQIPDDDRLPPGQSPASQIAGKSYLYDTYLAPEPYVEALQLDRCGQDHSTLIINTLGTSLRHFSARQQIRKVEHISLEIAKEYMRVGRWNDAHEILVPLWPQLTWRLSGWWDLMEDFAWTLRECSLRVQDCETLIWVHWELLNEVFSHRPTWNYDFHSCLENIPVGNPKAAVVLKAEDVVSCLSASLVFEKAEGNVGEPLHTQLVINSIAQSDSAPIILSEVKIVFEGSLRPIKLRSKHRETVGDSTSYQISTVTLRDSAISVDSSTLLSPTGGMAPMVGTADLTFKPSQTKVYNLTSIPREAGEAKIASIALLIEEEKFNLVYAITQNRQAASYWWAKSTKGPVRKRIGKDRDTILCKILPKPPKIIISTPNLRDTYYTNERVSLNVAIQNGEDEAAEVTVQIRLFGQPESAAKLSWLDNDEHNTGPDGTAIGSPDENTPHSISRSIGILARAASIDLPLTLTDTHDVVDCEIEISVRYSVVSDLETPISKTVVIELPFVRPFEANYEFLPRIHPQPWPNFFNPDDDPNQDESTSKPNGLRQKWSVNSKVVSFASEPLIIEKLSLVLLDIHGRALCAIGEENLISPEAAQIFPEELRESEFILNVQKSSLDDRGSASLNLALEIQWRRPTTDGSDANTASLLAIPRFLIPLSEPRILASALSSETLPGLIHLDYTLENPSMHFLTFNLTMEASEYFAFSGSKSKVVQLVPLSRHTVRYNLLAFKRGLWIQPHLVVIDTYFNKTLRILPTEGMQADKKGILVWVDADG